MRIQSIVLKVALAAGALLGLVDAARAQSWSESMTPGFWGGYNHFGGYYDTFGDFGGHSNYLGYVRTEGYNSRTVAIVTVPLQRETHRHAKRKATSHVVSSDSCDWLRRKAEETGKRKWKADYTACRRHA
jgi:hypothetical protein